MEQPYSNQLCARKELSNLVKAAHQRKGGIGSILSTTLSMIMIRKIFNILKDR